MALNKNGGIKGLRFPKSKIDENISNWNAWLKTGKMVFNATGTDSEAIRFLNGMKAEIKIAGGNATVDYRELTLTIVDKVSSDRAMEFKKYDDKIPASELAKIEAELASEIPADMGR